MRTIKETIKNIPFFGKKLTKIYGKIKQKSRTYPGSVSYWEERYVKGGNSGAGSYGRLAEYKAEFVNRFIKTNIVNSIIEFGCGDGHQLSLANYPSYIGLDVSAFSINICMKKFNNDDSKSFYQYNSLAFCDKQNLFQSDLSLSLDVIFHLVEDEIYHNYMMHLFDSGRRFVIIYSSNYNKKQNFHEKDRKFTDWVKENRPDWKLNDKFSNKYKFDTSDPTNTSRADFYIYEKDN